MKRTILTIFSLTGGLTSFSCYGYDLNIKPFVGGDIAINYIDYTSELTQATKDIGITMPEHFFGLGIETGAKTTINDGIYNAGLTFAYDYMFDSSAILSADAKTVFDKVGIGFSAISATFDNYIRVQKENGKRIDIILGIGIAQMTERFKAFSTQTAKDYGLDDINTTDSGGSTVIKIGANFQLSPKADFYVNWRLFIPGSSDGDIDGLSNLSTGLRFLF